MPFNSNHFQGDPMMAGGRCSSLDQRVAKDRAGRGSTKESLVESARTARRGLDIIGSSSAERINGNRSRHGFSG